MLKYFVVLFTSIVFSLYVAGIEISNDLFIEADNDTEGTVELEEAADSDIRAPKIKKAYKKQKVTIKRDISALDQVVDELQADKASLQSGELKDDEVFLEEDDQPGAREPSADEEDLYRSVDYGDYEVHWGRKKN